MNIIIFNENGRMMSNIKTHNLGHWFIINNDILNSYMPYKIVQQVIGNELI